MEAAAASPVVGVPLGGAAFAGVGTRPTARRGFTRKVPRRATAVCAAPAGVLSLSVLSLSVPVFPGTAAVRPVARRPTPHAGRAPAVPAAALLGGLAAAVPLTGVTLGAM
ncbi:hypothetical protein ACFU5P_29320 [Streptomyces sp. NPDC057433]|uniref:hypothetical protein n=1 Tax=Streptomyces sp. NPDC057433 TaxID=3346132 RepID=UPI0036923C8C